VLFRLNRYDLLSLLKSIPKGVFPEKSHSSSTCSEHRGHEQTSAAITPLVLSKLDFLQARQRKMGKRKNWASSQQNTYHLPQAPTATFQPNLPTSIPYSPFLYIPPKFTDDTSTPLIPAHLLHLQNSTIRLNGISSSKFPQRTLHTLLFPAPTQPNPAPLIHHTLIILPLTNQKKATKISLALTRPYHKTSRSHSQPPQKKKSSASPAHPPPPQHYTTSSHTQK